MKNLFTLAKYFAIKDKADEISKKHLLRALNNLEITDKKVIDFFKQKYSFKKEKNDVLIVSENIKEAQEHEKILFSKEVKDINKALKEKGYDFSSKISKFIKSTSEKLEFFDTINSIKSKLSSKVYSQDIAIEALADNLMQVYYKQNENAPKGIFFFLGPPATGKTYLATILHEVLDDYKMKVFDMSSYQSSNENFGLIGLRSGYSGAKEGELTSFVKKNPKTICVFDEIEKANLEAQNIFLTIMSEGKAVDSYTEKEIDFTQSILIFTSNLGSELYSNKKFLKNLTDDYDSAQSIILEAIGREKYETSSGGYVPKLKPEIISRLSQGDVILFNKLSFNSLVKIAKKTLEDMIKSFNDTFLLDVHVEDIDTLVKISVLSFAPMMDVRRIKSKLAARIMDTITDFLLAQRLEDGKESKVTLKDKVKDIQVKTDEKVIEFLKKHITTDEVKNDDFTHELFRKNKTINVQNDISLEKGIVTLRYFDPNIDKLPKSHDFLADKGGLTIDIPEISFEQIAGHDKVKYRLKEIVKLLKDPQKIEKFDVQMPKGMLLYGAPGTGKTMLAKAFANCADLPFISTTGTEILNIDTMTEVFKRAREYAPCIIFIDEIDAVGSRDGGGRDFIINQFLTELNGFDDDKSENIFVIAATNIKEKIDPALLRSGRIDLHVEVGMLDRKAREYFIDKILKKPTIGKIDKEKLINFSAGMTGADLEKVSRESSYEVIRKDMKGLSEEILLEQINILKYGEKLPKELIEKELMATAYHEAGHAVISYELMKKVKIEQITVSPRNKTLGFVSYSLEESIGNSSFEDIKNHICIAFAGRISQIKQVGEEGLDNGALNDLDRATKLAFHAIGLLGMDEDLGYISLHGFPKIFENGFISQKIQEKVLKLLSEQKERCEKLVNQKWKTIEKLAKELEEKESIDESRFLEIVK